MLMRNLIIGFFILLFVSCKPSPGKKYKLSDEQLAHLMLDLQMTEATLPDLLPVHRDSLKILFDKRLEEIYKLSKEDLKMQMELLHSDPEKLKWVVDRTKEMADSIQ